MLNFEIKLSIKLKNPEIINLVGDLSSIPIQASITTVPSERLVPSVSKHLFKNIKKSTDFLTDLCCAFYWILKQSLEMLNKSLVTPKIEQFLAKLFSVNSIKYDIIQLEKNIQKVHTFFLNYSRRGCS